MRDQAARLLPDDVHVLLEALDEYATCTVLVHSMHNRTVVPTVLAYPTKVRTLGVSSSSVMTIHQAL